MTDDQRYWTFASATGAYEADELLMFNIRDGADDDLTTCFTVTVNDARKLRYLLNSLNLD